MLVKDELLGRWFGETEKRCVKQRREMSLKTQTTGWKLGEPDSATKTWEDFEDLKKSKKGGAKMHRRKRTVEF